MQGKKNCQEKLFTNFQLSEFVPKDNFYRRLKGELDLSYLPSITKQYYGTCEQKSIDPIAFMKICLVGYLENIISDRRLMEHCRMRLDVRYFLGYDIDESLPWHTTLSRTRALYPKEVFERVFGSLTQFFGLSKLYNRGLDKAHKCMLMAGAAYNLKKLMKFNTKKLKITINPIEKVKQVAQKVGCLLFTEIRVQMSYFKPSFF